jgi:hypothetical protein
MESIMDVKEDKLEATKHRQVEAQRALVRSDLDNIALEVGTALREASLTFPVYLTVPNSGNSLATMACPLDPSDSEWSQALAIVCRMIEERLGDVRLRARELVCATANETIAAADVTADPTQSAG